MSLLGIHKIRCVFIALVVLLGPAVLLNGHARMPPPDAVDREGKVPESSRCGGVMEDLRFDSLLLKRRNWENHGTDIHLTGDGRYVVRAQFLDRSKKIREGTLSAGQLRRLSTEMDCADVFSLGNEYKGPFRSEWFWWGYELILGTGEDAKTIRFHSEDETAPRGLHKIVELVIELTK